MIQKIKVNYSEFCYFFTLTRQEQLNYFFSLYDLIDPKNKRVDMNKLKGFFEMMKDLEDTPIKQKKTQEDDHEKIDVMIDDEIIMLESNSIRAIRSVTHPGRPTDARRAVGSYPSAHRPRS